MMSMGGIGLGDVIELLDQVKADLRKELTHQFETEQLEKRLRKLEEDLDNARNDIDTNSKRIREGSDRIDGHSNLLAA